MTNPQIQFNDGAAYERYMGRWSQLVGEAFLDWLKPGMDLRWLDVGCGNGAFTEMLLNRCNPKLVRGIDPSQEQLAFARARLNLPAVQFLKADAMALPFADNTFDVAVMPLVIFFVPVPAKGVAEMARVVAPGGWVTAYSWDMPGGGFPYHVLLNEMRARGIAVPTPPSPEASDMNVLEALWRDAHLEAVKTKVISVERTFTDFEEYWSIVQGGPSVGAKFAVMQPTELAAMKQRMKELLPTDSQGRIRYSARANAIKGRVE